MKRYDLFPGIHDEEPDGRFVEYKDIEPLIEALKWILNPTYIRSKDPIYDMGSKLHKIDCIAEEALEKAGVAR